MKNPLNQYKDFGQIVNYAVLVVLLLTSFATVIVHVYIYLNGIFIRIYVKIF